MHPRGLAWHAPLRNRRGFSPVWFQSCRSPVLSLPLSSDITSRKMAVESVSTTYQQLESAWDRKELEEVGKRLSEMKVLLLQLSFLPSQNESLDQRELVLARNTLEIGALWSIENRDIPSFQRYMAQLKCYYFDYATLLPDSAYKYQILGLNLLCLLAENRLAEFHTELEQLPVEELKNIYIKHPISLEQFLMEGSFHKVLLLKGNVPAHNYDFFMDILIGTIRNEIASCVEKAYERISVAEAVKVLVLDSQDQLDDYVKERGWVVSENGTFFIFSQQEKKEKFHFVQNQLLIQEFLSYARELEKIV